MHHFTMDVVYSELSNLQKRLGSALNMVDTDNQTLIALRRSDRSDRGDIVRANVIEALPTAVWKITPETNKWKLATSVPALFQTTPSRLWFVNDCIRCTTSADDPEERVKPDSLPADAWFWQPTSSASCRFSLAILELHDLFKRQASLGLSERIPYRDETSTRGTYSLFLLPRNVKILMRDSMDILRATCPSVYELCHEYAQTLAQMYGVTMESFVNETQLVITRASTETGIPLQIHKIDAYNRGPLMQAVIGLKQSLHDIAPTLVNGADKSLLRFMIPEGTMVVLDGDARARHAHGMPAKGQVNTHQSEAVYYTLTFDMDYTNPVVSGFVPELRTPVLITPVLEEQVVSGRRLPDLSCFPPYMRTPAQITIKSMFSRIQALESFLITKTGRDLQDPASEEADHSPSTSLCVGENISSMIMAE